ncbi:helix-turn-helix domain-containing protein [Paracoccus spongiarum]|uniref:Helix-turn-helix transcriptional regulator n=1 Tax=Paracoccus spongiarum TaxID=3064387 RepID=A0ABT9JE97_9RHOB|nr:helix-turn-helix transcriptional regulator [Paracoccus sp. 2205BS29-5]MDP5308155.1 helix-turn-helix transcriptional regulator [Paracoccus sp. 2205BS29-5]
MIDVARPSELVHRLHRLRVDNGLTIQEMAERCGIPKSSLESYMRTEGARKPGLDALVAISDGMRVSLDWLVGRAADNFDAEATKKDFALACFNVVQSLIDWMRAQQSEHDTSIFDAGTVAGIPDPEIAAKSMLIFVAMTERFKRNSRAYGADRAALYDDLQAHLDREKGTK